MALSPTLTRVATAGVLIPIVVALVLWAPQWLFVGVLALVALLAMREYLDLAEKAGLAPLRYLSFLAVVALVAWPAAPSAVPLLILLALALAMRPARALDKALPGASATVLGILYIGMPMALLEDLRRLTDGRWWVMYVLVLIWVSDSAAYFVGRALGRHPMSPRISPGKTWEGAVASLIVGTAFGMAFTQYLFRAFAPIWYLSISALGSAIIALMVNVAGQFGDLAESALKRSAGVKDSSTILPGHGGFLDRVDALLFAVPALWYILALNHEMRFPGWW